MKKNHLPVLGYVLWFFPVVQRLQAPQAPTGTKPNQDNKPGSLVKAAPSALKAKGAGSDSSSTSDSEDDVAPAALKLPPLSGKQSPVLFGAFCFLLLCQCLCLANMPFAL